MTTKPMSAEDFAILIVCNSGSKYLQKNTVVPITKMIEQRDQAITAPLMERIKVLEEALRRCRVVSANEDMVEQTVDEALQTTAEGA